MDSGEFPIEDDSAKFICIDLTEGEGDSSKQRSSSNVVDYMFNRQKGQSTQTITFENAQFKPKRFFYTTNSELHIGSCEYINTGLDGESVVGLWKGDDFDGIVYKLKINLNSKSNSRDADVPANTIAGIEKNGPYFIEAHVADMCDTYIGNQERFLFVGKKIFEQPGMINSIACNFAFTRPSSGKFILLMSQPTCCSGCRYNNLYGIGTDEGIIIYKDQYPVYLDSEQVSAMELRPDGTVVYCGCHSNHLIVYDLRSQPTAYHKTLIDGLSSTGISSLKLLSNENLLIARSFDGIMTKIDLRFNGIATEYVNPDPSPDGRKIPFSVSESADLVCATGSDNITRLWSYTSGELLHKVNPWMPSTKTHSALFSSGLRWGVAMFQKNKMYVIEPWG